MTTILVINAASSLLAAVGIGGWFAWRERQVRRAVRVQPVYVPTRASRPLSRR
jgi:hypothetical protein